MLLVGHRGAKEYEPENTLRSFRAGIELGANAIEFDTRLTKDDKLVVFHDKSLERTTDGKGNVRDFTLKELQKLDAGKGERVSTAEEALKLITKSSTALLEIKDKDSVSAVASVVKKFIDAAHKWKFKVEVWVCNTLEDIRKFKKLGADGIASDRPDLFRKL